MAEAGGTRHESILIDAINPDDGTIYKIQLRQERLLAVARRSVGQAKECGYLLPAVLQHPSAIFEGLRAEEDEDQRGVGWRCYCGVPGVAYRTDGSERPAWPQQVFLVFVNEDRIAYNWRWEQADVDEPNLPVNYAERFQRRLL